MFQPTVETSEDGLTPSQQKKNESVRCCFVIEKKYHKKLKLIAAEEGKLLQEVIKDAFDLFFQHKEI